MPLNVATPATATAVLLVNVPALPSVMVTVSVKSVSTLPKASRALTTGCTVSATPETEPAGWVVNASDVATTLIAVPVLLVTALVVPMRVPVTVRSVSPSTDRM